MKMETIDSKMENRILLSMITDPVLLSRMSSKWNGKIGPLSSSYANLIGSWCVHHFEKHSEPPGSGIRLYFEQWARNKSADEISMVENHLRWLSSSWDTPQDISSSQMCSMAIEHINTVKVRKLLDQTSADLLSGSVGKAIEKITSFTKEEVGDDGCEDFLVDENEIEEPLEEEEIQKPLITFEDGPEHDGLRKFFGHELVTDSLLAFQGPEKSGKSFFLMEMAIQALLSRRRVAFFEVGDMSRKQIKRRFLIRISGLPIYSTDPEGKWPCTVKWPTKLDWPDKGDHVAKVTHTKRPIDFPLDKQRAKDACKSMMKHRIFSKKSFLKLCVYPNFTASVATIQSKLFAWKLAGWVPEVVIIDYADILAIPSRLDFRQAINLVWGGLRRLSEENHCLVITATQADAESYRIQTQDRRNFSEDKRKNAHVNGMIGINVTGREKELGLVRLNWIEGREVPWSSSRCLYLATCLALANPAVYSKF